MRKCWEISKCSSEKSKGCPAMKSGKSCWMIRKCNSCFPGGKKSCPVFKQHCDEVLALVKKAQAGCREANEELIKEYSRFVFQVEKKFFIPGATREDLFQEGFIGLFTAIKTYDETRNLLFEDYMSLCIRNAVIRAIRSATQKKQLLLTNANSIDADPGSYVKISTHINTEDAVMAKLKLEQLKDVIDGFLSRSEKEIMKLKLADFSVDEIALIVKEDKKKVENALYRARKKIKSFILPKVKTRRTKPIVSPSSLESPRTVSIPSISSIPVPVKSL